MFLVASLLSQQVLPSQLLLALEDVAHTDVPLSVVQGESGLRKDHQLPPDKVRQLLPGPQDAPREKQWGRGELQGQQVPPCPRMVSP